MNMQLVYAHTMGNWPLPVKGDTFSNLVFTISNYKAITIGTTMADSTGGASIYIWPQTLPAGE